MKTCNNCLVSQQDNAFYKKGRRLSSWCKECVLAHNAIHTAPQSTYTGSEFDTNGHRRHLSPVERHAYNVWSNARKRALRNGLAFDVSRADVEAMFKQFCATHHHAFGPRSPFRPSLDRIDNAKSYSIGNVRVCWLIENLARNVFTDAQVIEFCKRKLGLL